MLARFSHRLRVALVVFVSTLCIALPARADFSQAGPKLVGTGAIGGAFQANSVALSTNGTTAIVGGENDNPSGGIVGAAWIYTNSPGGLWKQQGLKLTGTNVTPTNTVLFGHSVAISGDGNTVLIAELGGSGGTNNGGGWVFIRTGDAWSQQAKLIGTNSPNSPFRATSVALSGDGNTAVVGCENDNTSVGAAWVFTRSGTIWTQQGPKLVGTGATGMSHQGFNVAISYDGNTILSGGYGDNLGFGAAWVFVLSGGVWTQQTKLALTGTFQTHQFGWSVALSGDGNVAMVGAPGTSSGAGGASFYGRSGSTWSVQTASGGFGATGTPKRGTSVSLSVDGTTAMMGGAGDTSNTGKSWIFKLSGGVWTQLGNSIVSTGATGAAQQGTDVALSGDGNVGFIGGPFDALNTGAVWPWVAYAPEISVEQPVNTSLTNGATNGFGTIVTGNPFPSLTFTIRNTGNTNLTGLTLAKDGTDPTAFTITATPTAPLNTNINPTTTFTVQFTPPLNGSGTRTANLHIANNDYDENPFNLVLTGTYLTFTNDTDGDGLNDASEFLMSPLGFNWQASQVGLVNNYLTNAPGAGLYTTGQVQALNVGAPLLVKSVGGQVTLTIGLLKSTNLTSFNPFPMTTPQTTINGQGELEFQFTPTDNAAFYRLESH